MQRKNLGWILFLSSLGIFIILVSLIYLRKEKVVVKDFLDREITFTKTPTRIVCLVPSLTEILFYLGLGDKVIGVSNVCDFPPEVLKKPRFDLYSTSEVKGNVIKEILNLQPDILLLWGISNNSDILMQTVKYIENKNVKVLTFGTPEDIEEIFQQIRLLGEIFNRRESAENLIRYMKKQIEQIKDKTKELKESQKPWVYVEIQKEPIFTMGRDNYLQQIIELAGGRNIFEDLEGYPGVTSEEVIKKDPQVIIIFKEEIEKEEILNRSGWQEITAVKEGRVYEVDRNLLNGCTPRIIEGLEELTKLLHPELFSN